MDHPDHRDRLASKVYRDQEESPGILDPLVNPEVVVHPVQQEIKDSKALMAKMVKLALLDYQVERDHLEPQGCREYLVPRVTGV